MNVFFFVTVAVSIGTVLGVLFGAVKKARKKKYSEKEAERTKIFVGKLANVLKYITGLFLIVGFVWCLYFLTLGVFVPEQAAYADSMSELIVSVLTVISIIFAFIEFTRRKDR